MPERTVYLEQLKSQNLVILQILINKFILVMALDLIVQANLLTLKVERLEI